MTKTQRKINRIFLNAVIDTCTFAALYGALRSPGDPKRLSGNYNIEEYVAMGDFVAAASKGQGASNGV